MDHVLPAGKVYQAGTLSGNPLATAAGLATLQELQRDPPYERLEATSARLAAGFHEAAESAGIPHQVARVGSMLTLFFSAAPVRDWDAGSWLRHTPVRFVLLEDAPPGHLSAVQPIRGPLCLRRTHRPNLIEQTILAARALRMSVFLRHLPAA